MRILAIHAHPDDVEFLAAGTLSLLAGPEHEITIVTMTPGDCGSREHGPDQIAAIRRREAKASATLIGARYLCAEFRDLAVFNDDPSRRRVTEMLRRTRPELVLAASPVDYLSDHEAASSLVRDCCCSSAELPDRRAKSGAAARGDSSPVFYGPCGRGRS